MKALLTLFFLSMIHFLSAQDLPYSNITETPETYTAGTIASRMIDGLGFRYYWATEGLTEKDLDFSPSKDARTSLETVNHVLELSIVILNATLKLPNGNNALEQMTFKEKRRKTLENLKQASDILKESEDISHFKIIFGKKEFPFWNAINGPIADAIWHCGQLVSFRRSSGNPFPKGVNVFLGKVKH